LALVLAVGKAACRCNVVDISKRFRHAVIIGNKANGPNAGCVNENAATGE
jgi:hypothetical protein